MVEQIPIGERVRDLVEDPSGRIVILTDSYSIVRLEPTQLPYASCSGCHGSGNGGPGLAPSLTGVYGREVASDAIGGDVEGVARLVAGETRDRGE
jgi:hypothetical protein